MFGLLSNLAAGALKIAVTPVAVAVDIVTLPESGESGRDPFSRTGTVIDSAMRSIEEAFE